MNSMTLDLRSIVGSKLKANGQILISEDLPSKALRTRIAGPMPFVIDCKDVLTKRQRVIFEYLHKSGTNICLTGNQKTAIHLAII